MNNNERRVNGFSFPLDKLQVFTWTVLVYFGLMFIGTFCASIAMPWSIVIGILFIVFYLLHLIFNLTVMAINPAEENDTKKITPVNNFDRQKHKHVIENQFCNICQMVVSCKAKHCRKCNKCITDFDHHCVYLNNCIGSKNYKVFILTISSAFLGACYIFIIGITIFILSFKKDQNVLIVNEKINETSNSTATEYEIKNLPIMFIQAPINLWRAFVAFTIFLSSIAILLIGYLISYHIFLKLNNMSTYEHTLKLRAKETKEKNADISKSTSKLKQISEYLSKIKLKNTSSKINKIPDETQTLPNSTINTRKETNKLEDRNINVFIASSALNQSSETLSPGLPCINYKNNMSNRYLTVDFENEFQSSDTSKISSYRSDIQDGYLYSNKLPPLIPLHKSKLVKLPFDDNDNLDDEDVLSLRPKKSRRKQTTISINNNSNKNKSNTNFNSSNVDLNEKRDRNKY